MREFTLDIIMMLTAVAVLAVVLWSCVTSFAAHDPPPSLGDEVTTTPEYTELFNDSFSGHIISIPNMYMVRDDNGNERAFESKWLTIIDKEE